MKKKVDEVFVGFYSLKNRMCRKGTRKRLYIQDDSDFKFR